MSETRYIKNRPHSVGGIMMDQAMLMPDEELVATHMLAVPAGETRSLAQLRAAMAAEQGADATCPVTTQRMIKIVAAKAVADHQAGKQAVPFWRVVEPGKPNTEKLAGGSAFVLARRADEKAKR